jgi:hypothetical protein
MPNSVCLRKGLLAPTSGVAAAEGGVDAGTSGVDSADGRVDAGASGVDTADGREDGGLGGEAETGEEARGAGVEARGAGVEARGAGVEALGVAVAVETLIGAAGGGTGNSSAPHSESISSVGGAMDGMGGLALTRSLSDRLSVIALQSAFHGRPHKSSASAEVGAKLRCLGQRERSFPSLPYEAGARPPASLRASRPKAVA